jgi:hypothetical protein
VGQGSLLLRRHHRRWSAITVAPVDEVRPGQVEDSTAAGGVDFGAMGSRGSLVRALHGNGAWVEEHDGDGMDQRPMVPVDMAWTRGRWRRLTSRRGAVRWWGPRGGGGWAGGKPEAASDEEALKRRQNPMTLGASWCSVTIGS